MKSQPKALYFLNFVSMWECFSYYGMRVLLVLFMIHEFNLTDSEAFGFYALYTTLVEFGGIFGGMIADKFLGLKRTILFGGWTIVFGHLSLIVPESKIFFYLGLGAIIIGTSLFRSNIAALIGKLYEENDERRDAGFTLYYTGINFGGFLAALACGIVGEKFGSHAGFGLAAFGMILGMVVFGIGGKNFLDRVKAPSLMTRNKFAKANFALLGGILMLVPLAAYAVYNQVFITPILPFAAIAGIYYIFLQTKGCTTLEKKGLKKIAIGILFLIIFYGCEEQIGSTLILFGERHIDRETLFGAIPASSLVMFNPLTILIIGPLLARLIRKVTLDLHVKIAIGFIFLSAAFFLLYAGGLNLQNQEMVSIGYLIGSIVLISLGELFIGPTLYAAAAKYAPVTLQGLVMGMITLGFSFSNLFSGILSQMMAVADESSSLDVYMNGFLLMTLLAATVAFISYLIRNKNKITVNI